MEVDGEELTLAYPPKAQFNKKKAESPANRAAVGEALATLAGGRWRLRYEFRDVPASEDGEGVRTASEQELIARFMDEFDAEEVTDEPTSGDGSKSTGEGAQGDGEPAAEAMTSDEKGT